MVNVQSHKVCVYVHAFELVHVCVSTSICVRLPPGDNDSEWVRTGSSEVTWLSRS